MHFLKSSPYGENEVVKRKHWPRIKSKRQLIRDYTTTFHGSKADFPISDEPYILKEMAFTKFAVQRGSPAYLRCRSISMPEPSFTWHMTSKLSHITKQVHPTDPNRGESVLPTQIVHGQINTYDSLLKLDNIRTEHYSTVFKCVAENGFGTDEHLISLTEPGRPDKPSQFHIVLTTPNSVRLSWNPGFDGGYNQTFALTVYQQRTGREVKKKTLEVNEMNWWLNETTISNLVPETSYLVRIQAKNKAGLSESYEELFVKTRGAGTNGWYFSWGNFTLFYFLQISSFGERCERRGSHAKGYDNLHRFSSGYGLGSRCGFLLLPL